MDETDLLQFESHWGATSINEGLKEAQINEDGFMTIIDKTKVGAPRPEDEGVRGAVIFIIGDNIDEVVDGARALWQARIVEIVENEP